MEPVDLIAFGAHPDDVEIGCGGLLMRSIATGYRVGIVDLTRGEMASTGTVAIRREESQKAAEVLGVNWRINLELPDRGITINDESLSKVVRILREARPRLIVGPYWEDRHPDHVACSQLVTEAHFNARLYKYLPELPPHQPRLIYYFLNHYQVEASFIVDISDYFEEKVKAIFCHYSQFGPAPEPTSLNTGAFMGAIRGWNQAWGALIGCTYGEGFYSKEALAIPDPVALLGGGSQAMPVRRNR